MRTNNDQGFLQTGWSGPLQIRSWLHENTQVLPDAVVGPLPIRTWLLDHAQVFSTTVRVGLLSHLCCSSGPLTRQTCSPPPQTSLRFRCCFTRLSPALRSQKHTFCVGNEGRFCQNWNPHNAVPLGWRYFPTIMASHPRLLFPRGSFRAQTGNAECERIHIFFEGVTATSSQ